jgi:hypothetical protein
MQIIFWVSFALLWLLVAIQGFTLLEVLRQIGQIRKQIGPQQGAFMQKSGMTGEPLPDVSGRRATDLLPANWHDYLQTDFGVIVLLSTSCITCRTIAEDLSRFAVNVKGEASIVAFVQGPLDEAQTFVTSTGLDRRLVIIDEKGTTARRLRVEWNPGVVTIRKQKIDQIGIINTVDQLDNLIHTKEREHVIAR